MTKPYLFFDAGGTIVFPDFEFLAKTAAIAGVATVPEKLFEKHCQLIYALDLQTKKQGFLDDPFPNGYPQTLFKDLVKSDQAMDCIVEQVNARNRNQPLWKSTHPWVADSLSQLKSIGFQMSVISNSDGRVEQILTDLGLRDFFAEVFDSEILGVSKPDPLIFEIALENLGVDPKNAVYVGDIYAIDVIGASLAGLKAVHLDPLGLYQNWEGARIPSIAHLENWLRQEYAADR